MALCEPSMFLRVKWKKVGSSDFKGSRDYALT
jgi:hypothetical protein